MRSIPGPRQPPPLALLVGAVGPLGAVLLCAGCVIVPSSVGEPDGWSCEVLPAEVPIGVLANEPLEERDSDPGYSLSLVVSSAHLDYSSTNAFFESLYKNPVESQKGVGHCWIVLESPRRRTEAGHTGEYGKERPTYADGVMALMDEGDPDPARYLWEEMHDGELLRGSGGRRVTYCCKVPITALEHERIRAFVEGFDYEVFALRGKGCSDYAAAAARLVGLFVANQVRLHLPPRLRHLGREAVLWSDPRYGEIVFGSPEVFEAGLRELVASGAAVECPYGE